MPRGKGKGSKGELEAAALLQAWWRRLEPETVLRRTPGSGGWSRHAGEKAKCDMRPIRGTCFRWPWGVEVKRDEECTRGAVENFALGRPSALWPWWEQAVAGAEHDGTRPMLWCRGNRMPWQVVFEEGGQLWLFEQGLFLALHPRRFAL